MTTDTDNRKRDFCDVIPNNIHEALRYVEQYADLADIEARNLKDAVERVNTAIAKGENPGGLPAMAALMADNLTGTIGQLNAALTMARQFAPRPRA
jgi:hypothetical protein